MVGTRRGEDPGRTRPFDKVIADKVSYYLFLLGSVAQLVEQRTENPRVGGSIPSRATMFVHAEVAQG